MKIRNWLTSGNQAERPAGSECSGRSARLDMHRKSLAGTASEENTLEPRSSACSSSGTRSFLQVLPPEDVLTSVVIDLHFNKTHLT